MAGTKVKANNGLGKIKPVKLNEYDLGGQTAFYGDPSSTSNDYGLVQQFQGNGTKFATGPGSFYFPNSKRSVASTGDGFMAPTAVETISSASSPQAVDTQVQSSRPAWATPLELDANGYGKTAPAAFDSGWGAMEKELAGGKTQAPKSYLGQAWDGAKDFLGVAPDAPNQTFADYSAGGGTLTEKDWGTKQFDQGRLDSQNFNNYAGLGLGVAGLASSLYSTFGPNGSMAMNKKNIQLMDQQIENNRAEMKNREGYRASIAKVFGGNQ